MDSNNNILKTELESLKSKLSSSSEPPSVVKVKSSTLVTVSVRKSLALRFKLVDKSWQTIVESAKLYAAEYVNLKPERVSAIREFVKRVNSMIDAHTSGLELSGYVLSQAYEKCSLALVGEDYLLESLDVIESRSKSCVFVFDEDEIASTAAAKYQDSRSNKKSRNSKKDEEENEEEKKPQKFKGSEFIFQRIKWDEKIDKSQVSIGYLDRFLGIKEIRFDEFKGVHEDKEGVPLHRIRYFKINDRIVWDREQKIDLLSGSGHSVSEFFEDTASASFDQVTIDEQDEAPSSVFLDGSVFEFSDNEWSTSTNKKSQNLLGGEFSLLSYNIMSKVNFKKSILSKMNFKKSQTEVASRTLDGLDNEVDEELGIKQFEKIDRMSRVLEAIRDGAWDVMTLQECDEHEESRLREDEFIRENYFICR